MSEPDSLRERFLSLSPHLDERTRSLWSASESKVLVPGARIVSAATGIAVSTTIVIGGQIELDIKLSTKRLDRRKPGLHGKV